MNRLLLVAFLVALLLFASFVCAIAWVAYALFHFSPAWATFIFATGAFALLMLKAQPDLDELAREPGCREKANVTNDVCAAASDSNADSSNPSGADSASAPLTPSQSVPSTEPQGSGREGHGLTLSREAQMAGTHQFTSRFLPNEFADDFGPCEAD